MLNEYVMFDERIKTCLTLLSTAMIGIKFIKAQCYKPDLKVNSFCLAVQCTQRETFALVGHILNCLVNPNRRP